MATQKLAQSDIDIIQNAVNRVHYYALRDARQQYIGNKPKTAGKMSFDRQQYQRIMVLLTVIKHFTGIEPQPLAENDANSFFNRFGMNIEHFDTPTENMTEDSNVPF